MITKIPYKDHDEWLSIRKNYIGGSDAGTVVGLNKYSSPYELWAQKSDKIPPFDGNTTTEVGSYLEEFVAQQFCKMTGKQVRKSNFTYVNDKYPWACANVDRLVVGTDAILEIKTTGNYEYIKHIRDGEPVPAWWCQITHYMTVLEKKKAYLAVLLDCREVKVLEFEFDKGESDALMAAEKDFWDHVTSGVPPAPDGAESTTDALKTIYADSIESTCNLFGRETLLAEYMALKQRNKENDARIAEIQNVICEEMQDAERGACGAYTVSWKAQERSTFQRKEFEKAHPEIDLSQYFKTSKSRPFKVTENKE